MSLDTLDPAACRYGNDPLFIDYHDALRLQARGEIRATRASLVSGGLPGASATRIRIEFSSGQRATTYQFQSPASAFAHRKVLKDFGVGVA